MNKQKILDYTAKNKSIIIALAILLLHAIALTWPFVLKPNSTIIAPLAGDVSSSITKFDGIKADNLNPFVDGYIPELAHPDGIMSNVGVDRVSFFSTIFLWLTTLATSSIFAHGLFYFLAHILTSVVTFFFVRSILKSNKVALFAALAISSFPLFISLARAAPVYNHIWLYVLPIWAFVNLMQSYSRKRLVVAILSVIPGFFWTPYFSFHIMLIGLALATTYLAILIKNRVAMKAVVWRFLAIGTSWISLCVAYYLLGTRSANSIIPIRTLQEAYDQSSHPLMYLLPGYTTWWGADLNHFLVTFIPRATSTTLYLGVSMVLLAAIGVYALSQYRKDPTLFTKRQMIFGISALSVTLFAFFFSLAPTVGVFGIEIPTPNYLVVHFVPALRASQRLVGMLMLGMVLLASIGLVYSLRRLRPSWRLTAFFIILAVVGLDISSNPLPLSSQAPVTPAISQLSRSPMGIVAQYADSSLYGDPSQTACQFKLQHKMPLLNHCGIEVYKHPDKDSITIRRMFETPLPTQPKALYEEGVRYVIIRQNDPALIRLFVSSGYFTQQFSDPEFVVLEKTDI